MENKLIVENEYKFTLPTLSEWHCELFGMGSGLVYRPPKGKEPNAFWRWMQYVCFGNKWIKDNNG